MIYKVYLWNFLILPGFATVVEATFVLEISVMKIMFYIYPVIVSYYCKYVSCKRFMIFRNAYLLVPMLFVALQYLLFLKKE